MVKIAVNVLYRISLRKSGLDKNLIYSIRKLSDDKEKFIYLIKNFQERESCSRSILVFFPRKSNFVIIKKEVAY